MRSLLWIVLYCSVLLQLACGGKCDGTTNSNDGGTPDPGLPAASGINIYNCSATEQIQVHKQKLPGGAWSTAPEYYMGSHTIGPCHAPDNLPISVDFGNGNYAVRVAHKTATGTCDLLNANHLNPPPCSEIVGSYAGDSSAAPTQFDFHQ